MEENMSNQEKKLELNDEQVVRNDEIYDTVFELCKVMAENPELEWDMNFIGEIADYTASTLTRHNIRVHFPAIVTNDDNSQHIEEYFDGSELKSELKQREGE